MPPRPPDDQLRRPRRRVRSPRHRASKVGVIVGPERPRHIVTEGAVVGLGGGGLDEREGGGGRRGSVISACGETEEDLAADSRRWAKQV